MPIAPAGLSPLGTYAPQVLLDSQKPPPAILADLVDPTTHELTSLFTGDDPVDAQVKIALSRVRGSGVSVTRIGQRFGDVRKLDEDAKTVIQREATFAMKPLVDSGVVRVEKSEVTIGPDWFEVRVVWTNLRTGRSGIDTRVTHPIGGSA
jgi:hypothetical protein